MLDEKKGVIVYISGSEPQDIIDLRRSLVLLHRNFNACFQYPIQT